LVAKRACIREEVARAAAAAAETSLARVVVDSARVAASAAAGTAAGTAVARAEAWERAEAKARVAGEVGKARAAPWREGAG
jgi:hypothetical protein